MRKLTHARDSFTQAESLDILSDLASRFACEGGEEGLYIARLVRQKRLYDVVHYEIDYGTRSVADIHRTRAVRQALAFFSKLEFLDIGIDKQASARDTFVAAESLCRETNEIYRSWKAGAFCFRRPVEDALYRAQRLIAGVVGDIPSLDNLKLRFGPGATSLTKKRDASILRKLGDGVSCSEELFPMAARLLAELPMIADFHATCLREEHYCDSVDAWSTVPVHLHMGKVSFAEKNAKTLRPVETQPTLNGMYQLGLADPLTACLRSIGIDLQDQSQNQRLAREGSAFGTVATIDLKSASDTIAVELVAHLLPVDLFEILRRARTGKTIVPWSKDPMRLEKFSAMGNGFTFPLETLIFWSLSQACTDATTSCGFKAVVYGDDIIVPVAAVPLLLEVLQAVGFLPNKQKSYWSGPFRESCGADFLFGSDIRPIYVKQVLTRANLFALHNGLVRKGWLEQAEWLRGFLDPALLLFGPDGFGDGHLLGDFSPSPTKRDVGYAGYTFKAFKQVANRDLRLLPSGREIAPFYTVYTRGSTPLVTGPAAEAIKGFFSTRKCLGNRGEISCEGLLVEPPLPIPFMESEIEGFFTKAYTLPGENVFVEEQFKKVSVYFLG